jgi:hypothetical protein
METQEQQKQATSLKVKFKEAAILAVVQLLLYGLLCLNYRAVAQTQYNLAALSDFTIASMNFFVIRKIAKSDEAFHQWLGYVIGSVAGSYLGIWISHHFFG